MILSIITPEKTDEGSTKMRCVIEEFPAEDYSSKIESHYRLNGGPSWELELRYKKNRELSLRVVSANICENGHDSSRLYEKS